MTDSTRPPRTQCGHWIGAEQRYCRAAQAAVDSRKEAGR
jgi:hypothetical protein